MLLLGARSAKGKTLIREHGERWLVRERDRSVLSRNLGLLLCPATYVGTSHLDSRYDRPGVIHQVDGESRWVRVAGDADFEIVGQVARTTSEDTA